MILQLQIITAAVLLVVSIMWFAIRKIKNYHKHFFAYLLSFSIALIISNVLFSLFALKILIVSDTVIGIFAKINLIFILITLYVMAMFILSKALDENAHRKIVFPFVSLVIFESFIVLVTDIGVESTSLALLGTSPFISHVFALINVFSFILIVIVKGKNINKWFAFVTIISSLLVALSIAVSYLFKINGIVEAGIIAADVLFFVACENPAKDIDNVYNCFKSNTISTCLSRFYLNEDDGFALFVGARSELLNEQSEKDLEQFRKNVIKELKTVPEAEVFLTSERDIFVVCDNIELYEDFVKDLHDVLEDEKKKFNVESNIKIAVAYMNDVHIAKDSDSLYKYLAVEKAYALNGYKTINERFINDKAVDKTDNEEAAKNLIINALNNDLVEVYYQPVYSSKEEKFLDAEALMRIKDVDGNIILPGKFIGVAEKTGLINQLGDRVFEKICQLLVNPEIENLHVEGIDINLSLAQCENVSLADDVIAIADKYNIDKKKINFEITESNFSEVHENLVVNVRKLSEAGFRISLDDFGTGKTDINYLIDLPISSVRIDRHVVWDYFDTNKTKTVVKQLINMCHELNISVVATGIEKINQLDEMASQNVDFIQGYYFFRPMPVDEYIKFLKPAAFEMDKAKANIIRSKGE